MPDVDSLKDEQDDPVDARDQQIEAEWSAEMSVLTPDCMFVRTVPCVRRPERMKNANNDDEKPSQDRENLVGIEGFAVEFGSLSEWVI